MSYTVKGTVWLDHRSQCYILGTSDTCESYLWERNFTALNFCFLMLVDTVGYIRRRKGGDKDGYFLLN